MDLRHATGVLMRDPGVANWLKLADVHIQSFNKMPGKFILPSEHAILKPLIEAFAYDANAFAQYIRALRDGLDGQAYEEVHELYRTVSLRALQAERRRRIRKGVQLVMDYVKSKEKRELSYEEQLKVGGFIEQHWKAMRLAHLAAERQQYRENRLTSEQQALAAEQFWKQLDTTLEQGTLPLDVPFDEVLALVTQ